MGRKINQKRFLQTSRLRGKIFHWFFMTFNVDKTALRNSLWSRGTGSAWGQRGRTLQQGNLLGLNISKKQNKPFSLPFRWLRGSSTSRECWRLHPQTHAREYRLGLVDDGQPNKASAEGQPLDGSCCSFQATADTWQENQYRWSDRRWWDRCWHPVGSGCLLCIPTRRLVKAPGWLGLYG